MKISDIIKNSKGTYPSLEIVPPVNGITRDELLTSIKPFMEFSPRYINVTCHRDEVEFHPLPDGTFSRHIVKKRVSEVAVCAAIKSAYDIEVVPHIICGGATADQIEGELHDLKFLGINNVLALRGDSILGEKRFTPTAGGYAHANELVEGIRKFETKNGGDFCVGVGAYPEKHFEAANIETDIENLKKKVDAGADYIITQMFFDNQVFYDFEKRCREAGITVPILPGLKPLSTKKQIEVLPEAFSLDIPKELTDEVKKAGDDKEKVYTIGMEWCAQQCKDLIKHGVPAVHFYTMGKAKNIVGILKECF
ncbi:MAG: methylenetetrahydrofolate reductase [NAD(P)H] [Bacteroidales bacterium]|nr:methylenetetrahydrofolate reductase [NAD(P)H] [Bacteroidales bacterium]